MPKPKPCWQGKSRNSPRSLSGYEDAFNQKQSIPIKTAIDADLKTAQCSDSETAANSDVNPA